MHALRAVSAVTVADSRLELDVADSARLGAPLRQPLPLPDKPISLHASPVSYLCELGIGHAKLSGSTGRRQHGGGKSKWGLGSFLSGPVGLWSCAWTVDIPLGPVFPFF
jgi:hypothetical protein